jgi:competence protein ComEC
MSAPVIHIWKRAPFIRMLLPMMIGIIIEWYYQITPVAFWILCTVCFILAISFFTIPLFERFKRAAINGATFSGMFFAIGALLVWYQNIQHDKNWFGRKYEAGEALVVSLKESVIEKTKSFKANATVDLVLHNGSAIPARGTIILYFKKDSIAPFLSYGDQLVINNTIQEIKNSGNPGGFDYKRYSLFQGITHQVFLKENQFEILPTTKKKAFNVFINNCRTWVLNILRTNIRGEKELGLAEALLIGYKDDLDKSLVQSYSNTGVVHVIAISGLHLGLIYWLLTWIFKPLKKFRLLKPIFILSGLWLFTLLAGAQPSVLRSAAMFSCIILGEAFEKKTSIYNSLALSAVILLSLNPFWLWDVGFQLSYAAVLSIVIFMQPIYHWFFIKNKLLDLAWKLNAVTIAAQILTMPVGIYHFHQFPTSFWLTNFVAVPLSSIILFGEILLCTISFIPFVAGLIGDLLYWLIKVMNTYIEWVEKLPFSLWDGLQITILQAFLLFVVVVALGHWLIEKSRQSFTYGLTALLGFVFLRTFSFIQANHREQIIVYNVPQKQAIDLIDGRKYLFVGDSGVLTDEFVRNFHINPSRVRHRLKPATAFNACQQTEDLLIYKKKKILLINETKQFAPLQTKATVDVLIISGNPRLYFSKLLETFNIKQVVFDGSCRAGKINYWKKDCDSLQVPYHDVSEKGAFVMSLR